jgi:hypothetical protein
MNENSILARRRSPGEDARSLGSSRERHGLAQRRFQTPPEAIGDC